MHVSNPDAQNLDAQLVRFADMLAALGAETRLRIVRLLLSAHPEGLVVGEIGSELEIAPSTLSHLDKYIQAIGGAQQISKLTSFVAKGTYEGFDTGEENAPVEIYAKAPNQITTIVHIPQGDSVRTYNGGMGWTTSNTGTLCQCPS